MIQVTELGIKGIGPFTKGQRLPVLKGITYVYGVNRITGEDNSNAAGKSLLTATVGEVIYEAPMVGVKQDKLKTGLRYIKYLSKGKQVQVTRSGRKLTVEVDGKQVAATKTKAADALAKLWPISEDEYRTYGYLDSRVPHPLVMGTSLQRKAFFSEFFGLDQLTAEKKVVLQHLGLLREARAALTEVSATYEESKNSSLDKASLEEIRSTIKSLEAKVEASLKQARRISHVKRLVAIEDALGDKVPALLALAEVDEDAVAKAERQVRQASRAAQALEDYQVYRNELKRWQAAVEQLPEYDLKDLRRASAAYDEAKAVRHPGAAPAKVHAPADPGHSYDELVVRRGELQHELDHLDKFKHGVCDKCGQPVKAKRDRKSLQAALAQVRRQLEEVQAYRQAQEEYVQYKGQMKEWRRAEEEYQNAQSTVKANKKAKELHEKVRSLPTKPEKVDKPDAVDLRAAEHHLELVQIAFKHRDDLQELRKLDASERAAAVEHDTDKLVRLQDKLSTLRTRLAVHESTRDKVKALRERMAYLKEQLADEEVLRALLKGYDDKAVKRLVVEAISEHFMAALNSYSGLVFPGYKFHFEWTSTQVALLVTRPGHSPTDVRSLSGAEAKLFTLISVMALLKFVPKKKRLSLIVLDEPTASFGPQSTELFHKLLPHMNKLIPSIIVVTPRTEESYPGAHEFTVVRDHTGAKVCRKK